MREVTFQVIGEPQGKARPKFARQGNFVTTYTPKKTVDYERQIKTAYITSTKGYQFSNDKYLCLEIAAYFGIPKSYSKSKVLCCLENKMLPNKKPDIDNIVKVVADALNGVAYKDDKNIVSVIAHKRYSDCPKIIVRIKEVMLQED